MDWFVVASCLFTLVHLVSEVHDDGGPLWDYFGPLAGVVVPDLLGFLTFTAGLGAALFTISCLAWWYEHSWALSLLLGLRVGDAVISHWTPQLLGKRPNPGLRSSWLYAGEAILLSAHSPLDFWWIAAGRRVLRCGAPVTVARWED